jgi:hypothetical protein
MHPSWWQYKGVRPRCVDARLRDRGWAGPDVGGTPGRSRTAGSPPTRALVVCRSEGAEYPPPEAAESRRLAGSWYCGRCYSLLGGFASGPRRPSWRSTYSDSVWPASRAACSIARRSDGVQRIVTELTRGSDWWGRSGTRMRIRPHHRRGHSSTIVDSGRRLWEARPYVLGLPGTKPARPASSTSRSRPRQHRIADACDGHHPTCRAAARRPGRGAGRGLPTSRRATAPDRPDPPTVPRRQRRRAATPSCQTIRPLAARSRRSRSVRRWPTSPSRWRRWPVSWRRWSSSSTPQPVPTGRSQPVRPGGVVIGVVQAVRRCRWCGCVLSVYADADAVKCAPCEETEASQRWLLRGRPRGNQTFELFDEATLCRRW